MNEVRKRVIVYSALCLASVAIAVVAVNQFHPGLPMLALAPAIAWAIRAAGLRLTGWAPGMGKQPPDAAAGYRSNRAWVSA